MTGARTVYRPGNRLIADGAIRDSETGEPLAARWWQRSDGTVLLETEREAIELGVRRKANPSEVAGQLFHDPRVLWIADISAALRESRQ